MPDLNSEYSKTFLFVIIVFKMVLSDVHVMLLAINPDEQRASSVI